MKRGGQSGGGRPGPIRVAIAVSVGLHLGGWALLNRLPPRPEDPAPDAPIVLSLIETTPTPRAEVPRASGPTAPEPSRASSARGPRAASPTRARRPSTAPRADEPTPRLPPAPRTPPEPRPRARAEPGSPPPERSGAEPPSPGRFEAETPSRAELEAAGVLRPKPPEPREPDRVDRVARGLPGRRARDDRARRTRRRTGAEARAARAAARAEASRTGRFELEPTEDGGYVYRDPHYSARITPEGGVVFRDKARVKPGFSTQVLAFDVTEAAMDAAGDDVAAFDKRAFMAATEKLRGKLQEAACQENLQRAVRDTGDRLLALWRDASRPPAVRRARIFQMWDECLEEGDPARLEAARAVRTVIERFVRTHLPEGSPDAFRPEELLALNRGRTSKARFDPYREPPPGEPDR